MYIIRLNKDKNTEKSVYNFSISTDYDGMKPDYVQTLRTISRIKPEEVDAYCKDSQFEVTYLEIFDENHNMIYESDYWNIELSLYINYNQELKTLEVQRIFIHK